MFCTALPLPLSSRNWRQEVHKTGMVHQIFNIQTLQVMDPIVEENLTIQIIVLSLWLFKIAFEWVSKHPLVWLLRLWTHASVQPLMWLLRLWMQLTVTYDYSNSSALILQTHGSLQSSERREVVANLSILKTCSRECRNSVTKHTPMETQTLETKQKG
jgi:hypothetical protein